MPRRTPEIRWNEIDPHRLPDVVSEGVTLVLLLCERGILEQMEQRLRIERRSDGVNGLEVVLFLLYYYASNPTVGVRTFYKPLLPYRRALGAVALREELAHPSSVSRALEAVQVGQLQPELVWLLSDAAGIDVVLSHPCVMTYDTTGQSWHVFDFDGTVKVCRQRALPDGEDAPAPVRRTAEMSPGYPGKKRGEVQFTRATLQHVGSSCWLYESILPGNGDVHQQFAEALSVVSLTLDRLSHPRSRSLLRMDGQYGWVPFYVACREKGIPFLTRLTRPDLFEQPDIRHLLREGVWQRVPDSGSGPMRGALDLGHITVAAGDETKRPDGRAYEPVTVRVVVCRYPKQGKKNHGVLIAGWQYELFATDLPADAFPAPEVVACYFGRAAIENRLAQEDREAGLDRLISYHLPGQELACAVGLFVWNLRVVRGFLLTPPPRVPPHQGPYTSAVDERVAAVPLLPTESLPGPVSELSTAPQAQPAAVASAPVAQGSLHERLDALSWSELLSRQPGWRWAGQGQLLCPAQRPLQLSSIRAAKSAQGRMALIFVRPKGGCQDCSHRASCFGSRLPRAAKHKELYAPASDTPALKALQANRRAERPSAVAPPTPKATDGAEASAVKYPRRACASEPGPCAVHSSLFLPALARSRWRAAAASLTARVWLIEGPSAPLKPVLLARDEADRQHRRKTWQQRHDHHALRAGTRVQMELTGNDTLRELLQAAERRWAA